MEVEKIKKYYKGNGVKVAIIDTGISENVLPLNFEVKHYIINDNLVILSKQKYPINTHGSICCLSLLQMAPNIELYDINILDIHNQITESNLIKAIGFCINEKIDVINISLGFEKCSNLLLDICKKAISNDIIIIAAEEKKNKITFPADINGVIKVTMSNTQDGVLKVLDNNYVSIKEKNFEGEVIINEQRNCFNAKGTSIACSFFSGLVAILIESRPFISKQKVIKQITKVKQNNNVLQENVCEIKFKNFDQKTVIAIIDNPLYNLLHYKNIINKNIIGFYDIKSKSFLDFNNNMLCTDDFNQVLVINSSEFARKELKFNHDIESKHIKFVENHEKKFNTLLKSNSIYKIKTPIIVIGSFGYCNSKFCIQVELYKQLKKLGIHQTAITYNPLGTIFDFIVYDYLDRIIFPDIVYSINNSLKEIEEKDISNELFLINIGSGIKYLTKQNSNTFGALVEAFLKALTVDIFILSINPCLSIEVIKNELLKLKAYGIPRIIIIISQYSYTYSPSNTDGLSSYLISNKKYNQFFIYMKGKIKDYPIFILEDVYSGKVTNYIINELS